MHVHVVQFRRKNIEEYPMSSVTNETSSTPSSMSVSDTDISNHNSALILATTTGNLDSFTRLLAQRDQFRRAIKSDQDLCCCSLRHREWCTKPKPISIFHEPLDVAIYVAPIKARVDLVRSIIEYAHLHVHEPDTVSAQLQISCALDLLIQKGDPRFDLPLEVDIAIVTLLASSPTLIHSGETGEVYFTRLSEGQYRMSADRRVALMRALIDSFGGMRKHEWVEATSAAYSSQLPELFYFLLDHLPRVKDLLSDEDWMSHLDSLPKDGDAEQNPVLMEFDRRVEEKKKECQDRNKGETAKK